VRLPQTLARLKVSVNRALDTNVLAAGGAELRNRGRTVPTSQPRIYRGEARHHTWPTSWPAGRPVRSLAPRLVSSASHQVGMAAVAATWPTSGVWVALLPAWRARSANWAELITAAPPGSLLK
jgi:hypothetical protein